MGLIQISVFNTSSEKPAELRAPMGSLHGTLDGLWDFLVQRGRLVRPAHPIFRERFLHACTVAGVAGEVFAAVFKTAHPQPPSLVNDVGVVESDANEERLARIE